MHTCREPPCANCSQMNSATFSSIYSLDPLLQIWVERRYVIELLSRTLKEMGLPGFSCIYHLYSARNCPRTCHYILVEKLVLRTAHRSIPRLFLQDISPSRCYRSELRESMLSTYSPGPWKRWGSLHLMPFTIFILPRVACKRAITRRVCELPTNQLRHIFIRIFSQAAVPYLSRQPVRSWLTLLKLKRNRVPRKESHLTYLFQRAFLANLSQKVSFRHSFTLTTAILTIFRTILVHVLTFAENFS